MPLKLRGLKEKLQMNITCNQCKSEMMQYWIETHSEIDPQRVSLPVCTKAACPNYGLLQVPIETMRTVEGESEAKT